MFLRYNLWKIKKAASSSRQFRAALWRKLSEEPEMLKPAPCLPAGRYRTGRQVQHDDEKVFFWQMPTMRYAAVALSLVLALGLGTGAYAYSSPEVNEAHPLYGLKKEIEKIEERVAARTPERQAAFQVKQMERRLAEIERLQAKKLNFEKTLEELNEAEENGLKKLPFVTSPKVQGIIKQRIEQQVEARARKLEEVKDELPPAVEQKIEAVMQKRAKRLEIQEQKIENKLEQMENRREEIQPRPINNLPNKGRAEEKIEKF